MSGAFDSSHWSRFGRSSLDIRFSDPSPRCRACVYSWSIMCIRCGISCRYSRACSRPSHRTVRLGCRTATATYGASSTRSSPRRSRTVHCPVRGGVHQSLRHVPPVDERDRGRPRRYQRFYQLCRRGRLGQGLGQARGAGAGPAVHAVDL